MRKFTYSKVLPIITGIIFILCLIRGLFVDLSNVMDTTVYVTAISVSSAIFGSTIVQYMKKAALENGYKLKSAFYESSMNNRLHFNEEMMKLKQQYSMTDSDICDIESQGEMDEVMSDAFTSTESLINQNIDENQEVSDIQFY